jgi:uridine kinase
VAIDGVDGAGKTTFADEFALTLADKGISVVRASVDGFHNSRAIRYRRGRDDPKGFFLDSYNYDELHRYLLNPFREGADIVNTSRFDHESDLERSIKTTVNQSSILVIDGIFLHRDELFRQWDFSIFLSVPFSVSYARMALRDGSNPSPCAIENKRYYEGQQIYLRTSTPEMRASVVIENSVFEFPKFMTPLGRRPDDL